ncbi:hypothetical protein Tco_1157106 [Tanacetum coccineum]
MLDMIPNGVYRAKLEVRTIINKMREGQLRWFEHVRRRPQSVLVRRVKVLVFEDRRRRVNPIFLNDEILSSLKALVVTFDVGCPFDDLLVLIHRDFKSVGVIKEALDKFSKVSSLIPSIGKSTIFFSNVDVGEIQ